MSKKPRASDALVGYTIVEGVGLRFDVTGIRNVPELVFSSIEMPTRSGAISVPEYMTADLLNRRLATITPADALQAIPTCRLADPRQQYNFLDKFTMESPCLDWKEGCSWWTNTQDRPSKKQRRAQARSKQEVSAQTKNTVKADKGDQREENNLDVFRYDGLQYLSTTLATHYKTYTVAMHRLDLEGRPAEPSVVLGVRDSDRCVVGFPCCPTPDEAKTIVSMLTDVLAGTFPCPPMKGSLTVSEVLVPLDRLWQSSGMVVTLRKPSVAKQLQSASQEVCGAKHGFTVLLATHCGEYVAVVAPPEQFVSNDYSFKTRQGRADDHWVGNFKVTDKCSVEVVLVDRESLVLLKHAVIEVKLTIPEEAIPVRVSSALLRSGSFSCQTLDNDRKVWDLCPVATWAFLRHRASPRSLLEFVHLDRHRLFVVLGRSAPGVHTHMLPGACTVLRLPFRDRFDISVFAQAAAILIGVERDDLLDATPLERTPLFLVDDDPYRLARLVNGLRGSVEHRVVDVHLVMDWSPDLLTSKQSDASPPNQVHHLSAAGREIIRSFLCGTLRTPLDQALLLHGSFLRMQEQTFVEAVNGILDANEHFFEYREARSSFRGVGTTTTLRRAAEQINANSIIPTTCLYVCAATRQGLLPPIKRCLQTIDANMDRLVLLVDGTVSPSDANTVKRLVTDLCRQGKILTTLLVEVSRYNLGEPYPHNKMFMFTGRLDVVDLDRFVHGYCAEFPAFATMLTELAAVHRANGKPASVHLLGLTVAAGAYHPAQRCIEELLAQLNCMDMEGKHHRQYLTALSLLEVFAYHFDNHAAMGCGLGAYRFNNDWMHVLEDPCELKHRFTNPLWAFPILTCVGLEIVFGKNDHLQLKDRDAVKMLAECLKGALTCAVEQNMFMMPWTRKLPVSTGLSREPIWMQTVQDDNLVQDILLSLLEAMRQKSNYDKTVAQVNVLILGRLEPRHDAHSLDSWTNVIQMADKLVAMQKASSIRTSLLIRHKRGSLLGKALSRIKPTRDKKEKLTAMASTCLADFTHCLLAAVLEKRPVGKANKLAIEKQAVTTVISRLHSEKFRTRMDDPVAVLANDLQQLLADSFPSEQLDDSTVCVSPSASTKVQVKAALEELDAADEELEEELARAYSEDPSEDVGELPRRGPIATSLPWAPPSKQPLEVPLHGQPTLSEEVVALCGGV